jgi:hypothetical protein
MAPRKKHPVKKRSGSPRRGAAKPAPAKPAAAKPAAAKSAAAKPAAAKSGGRKSSVRKSSAGKPAVAPATRRARSVPRVLPHGPLRPPYLHYVGARQGVRIWTVDGAYVRKNIDEEFSNFGHHYSIAEIPVDEIWLDQEAHPDEQRFFITHAIVERRAMVDGKTYDVARHLAIDAEYRLRAHCTDLRRVAP